MKKSMGGYTIVEILIVIVVVSILVAITAGSYTNYLQRSRNSTMITTVKTWYKALALYKVRNDGYPAITSCLGEGYKWGISSASSQGAEVGQCYQVSATGYVENATFKTAVAKFANGAPTPPFVTMTMADGSWRRGAYFVSPANTLNYVIEGTSSDCNYSEFKTVSSTTYNSKTLCTITLP